MKKALIFLSLFFLLSGSALAASFPDVAEDNKNYKAIKYLEEKGIINGYADGTFGPDKLVNRAEALKIISGALKLKTDGTYEVLFPDVKKTDWYFPYVMSAKNSGIVGGYKDGKFKPTNPINLAESLKILLVAAKIKFPEKVTENVFTDVGKDVWFAGQMKFARDHNMLLSDDYGAVHPDQSMTRAAFAELVYRMMIIQEKNGEPFPLEMNWITYNGTTLPFKVKYDDKSWKIIEGKNQVSFLRPDKQYSQFSPLRIYPNSGVVMITIDENTGNMVSDQYFTNIKSAFPGGKYKKFKIKDLNALEVLYESKRTVDWYIYLSNNKVLVVYTEYGNGALGFQLQQAIKAMLGTLEYKEVSGSSEDYSGVLSKILETVLVKNKGMESLNTLPEKIIIETDTLGAGNGPVDYYFSEKLNYTFKYERTDDVILDTREGKTSAF